MASVIIALLLVCGPLLAQGWRDLDSNAEALYQKGQLEEAARVSARAIEAAAKPAEKARSLDRLGFFEWSLGKRADAERHLLEALELRQALGRETSDYADTLLNLALLYRDMRRLDEALKFATEGTAIRAQILTRSSVSYAEGLNILGTVHFFRGEYQRAYETLDEGLTIHEAQLNVERPSEEYGTLCANFANVAQRIGKYNKASELFDKALNSLRKNPGVEHPAYSTAMAGSAFLYQDLGKYKLAEKAYADGLRLLQQQLPEGHPLIGAVHNNRAVLYQTIGNREAAEASYRAALAIKRKGDQVSLAVTLRNYGRLLFDRDPAQAESLYRESVDILDHSPKPPAYEHSNALLSLGEAQLSRSQLDEALATLRRAVSIVATSLGERHPLHSMILRQLARVAEAKGEFEKAEQLYEHAIDIVAASKGRDHPEMAVYLIALANLNSIRGNLAAALRQFREAASIQDATQARVLGVGSEAAKAAMLANLDQLTPALIDFQAKAGAKLPESRSLAFQVVTHRKARVVDFVRDWREALRNQAGSSVRPLLDEWQALVECQVTLAVALGYRDFRRPVAGACDRAEYELLAEEVRSGWTTGGAERALHAVQELRQRTLVIEERLSRDFPAFREGTGLPSVQSIRNSLRSNELLVEVVRYDVGTRVRPAPHYAAFVVDGTDQIDWIELGPASAIDTAITDLLRAAEDWSGSDSATERSAYQRTATNIMEQMSGSFHGLWRLLSTRRDIRRLRIAPDGMFLLLPFEALRFRGRPLLRRFEIGYVLTGRELVGKRRAKPSESPLIVVSPGMRARSPRVQNTFRTLDLERLSAADAEARQLQGVMPRAQLLGENRATEAALKQVRSPLVLHVIGHGMVRGNEPCMTQPEQSDCPLRALDAYLRIMNLSVIVLEEAYGRGGGSAEDGLLTAQELRELDLGGTQMLVLSQCRMADGIPTSGDGVYGMRRAASLAGVQTFVAPLWRVVDQAQQTLMTRFYKELSWGRDPIEALRSAKLQLMGAAQTNHFLYWAPTILSGRAEVLPRDVFSRTQ